MRRALEDGTVIEAARADGRYVLSVKRPQLITGATIGIELVLSAAEAELMMDCLMIEYVQ